MRHFISGTALGERCRMCGGTATHKVGEEIPPDDPAAGRHNLTAYVCCTCFRSILGPEVPCDKSSLTIVGR